MGFLSLCLYWEKERERERLREWEREERKRQSSKESVRKKKGDKGDKGRETDIERSREKKRNRELFWPLISSAVDLDDFTPLISLAQTHGYGYTHWHPAWMGGPAANHHPPNTMEDGKLKQRWHWKFCSEDTLDGSMRMTHTLMDTYARTDARTNTHTHTRRQRHAGCALVPGSKDLVLFHVTSPCPQGPKKRIHISSSNQPCQSIILTKTKGSYSKSSIVSHNRLPLALPLPLHSELFIKTFVIHYYKWSHCLSCFSYVLVALTVQIRQNGQEYGLQNIVPFLVFSWTFTVRFFPQIFIHFQYS